MSEILKSFKRMIYSKSAKKTYFLNKI
ncbi:Hypothetical Protein MfeM64YM_0967 [Mycoplasmopsis fermentans M64]|uniref:Uncharacterized protein n=1 Tax=Mycoplasmopsis fermentans (strain M64) TaxID=943945 RepID=A0AB32XD10_MYCFM|nr:Hypothetical Protein MfeM64YM_0967 [Mycoplasmopsis fermentans M64]